MRIQQGSHLRTEVAHERQLAGAPSLNADLVRDLQAECCLRSEELDPRRISLAPRAGSYAVNLEHAQHAPFRQEWHCDGDPTGGRHLDLSLAGRQRAAHQTRWWWRFRPGRRGRTTGLPQQGPIEPTGQTWDLALDGPGFFQVQQTAGTIAYTRDGAFHLDQAGRLVTADGLFVLPPITIPVNAQEVYVDRDGVILARINGQTQQVGVLQLARFPNPEGLRAIGANRYVATAASGAAQVAQAGFPGYAEIVSRALERSNVDLASEMMSMMIAQRAYGLSLQTLQMADRMHELALELRT